LAADDVAAIMRAVAAVVHRARLLLGRGWRASVALALVAGLVGGLALAAWAAGRRDRGAYARFVGHVAVPQYAALVCGPGVTPDQVVGDRCPAPYQPAAEVAFVRSLPGVEAVAQTDYVPVAITVGGRRLLGAIEVTRGDVIAHTEGNPIYVQGRAPQAADEVAVNESAAPGFGLGATATIQPQALDGAPPLPEQPVRLVGIARFPIDLVVAESKVEQVTAITFAAPAWWDVWGAKVQPSASGILARLAPGTSPDAIRAALAARWPGRYINDLPLNDAKVATVHDAIGYEANASNVLAATIALAGIVFVGQALALRSRREQTDLATLSALGFTRRQGIGSAGLRNLPVAFGAAVVAALVGWLSSAWTPIGLAAKAEPAPGLQADLVVLALGAAAVAAVVLVATVAPVVRTTARHAHGATYGSRVASAAWLPPTAVAGIGMASSRRAGMRLGAALAALAVAAAVIVATATVGTSLDDLVVQPARYGVRWDGVLEGADMAPDQVVGQLPAAAGIAEAGGMYQSDGLVGGRPVPVVAVAGIKGTQDVAWSSISAGRAPERDGEVALGAITMRAAHAHLGSVVVVQVGGQAAPTSLTVVGQAVFNDSSSLEAGVGALVTKSLFTAELGDGPPDQLLVRFTPGASAEQTVRPFVDVGARWFPPTPPATIRNLERVRWLPWALALLVAALAAGALANALVTSVRAHRRDLAVYRTLGFTSGQACGAVVWEALVLAAVAVAIGIPLGIALGHGGWSLLADQIGVPADAGLPLVIAAAVAAGVVLFAGAIALWPGWRASHVAPARALRTE
jgi:hypothetical protein